MSFYLCHRAAIARLAAQELDAAAPAMVAAKPTAACFSLSTEGRGALTAAFGLLVRELRQAGGLSQEQLAERAGLHRTYIGCIERGEKTVTIETAGRLAGALDLSLARLFEQLEQAGQPAGARQSSSELELAAAELWLN